ncbi:MAG TPA: CBS domain-containing protein [Thermoplasmatales archaeon]|nr:CBS domain-containing protein [Thermoplasmatales archaeon]
MKDFYDLKVEDVMHDKIWDIPLIEENANLRIILIILTARGYAWVVENSKSMRITGVITEHDVLRIIENFDEGMIAKDFAKKDLITCSRKEKISDVINKIKKYGVRRIPVVENGKIVGEITLRHLIEKVYSLVAEI